MPIIHTDPYGQSMAAAERELAELEQHSKAVEQRIAYLKALIDHLKPLSQTNSFRLTGAKLDLPGACRDILMQADGPLSAPEIRHRLALLGIDLGGYTNPMAVLHATLKRIARAEKRGPITVYGLPTP